MKCPNCNSTNLQKKGMRAGKQRYKCKDCEANFTEGVPYKKQLQLPPVSNIVCRNCGNTSVIRDGKLEDGSQRFKCPKCKLSFSTKPPRRLSSVEKIDLIKAVLIGGNIKKLTLKYNCTSKFIEKLVSPYYAAETITPNQKKDIIKYGYYLKVPVDYMAEYIKCSEHKCTEVIENYKERLMSTSHDAT